MAASLSSRFAVFCAELVPVLIEEKGVHALIRFKYDIASAAAVTPVRAAGRHIFLPAEADMAVTALTGAYIDSGVIQKHLCPPY